MNQKGFNWTMLIMAPALLVILIAAFPVLDVLLQQLDTTLTDNPNIMYGNIITIMAGSVGMILVAGIIWTVVTRAQSSPYAPPPEL